MNGHRGIVKCSICGNLTNNWIDILNANWRLYTVFICKQCAGYNLDWIEFVNGCPKGIIVNTIHIENCTCFEDDDPDDDFELPIKYEKLNNPDYCYEYREVFDLPENTIHKLDEIIKHSN